MKKTKISCLPVAGIENPYQYLMMNGLNESPNLEVQSGIHDKFFGIFRTALIQKPDYIHFDWETSYYYRKNIILTLISIPLFIVQVLIAKYIFRCKLVWTPHNLIPHDAKHLRVHNFCRVFFAKQMSWIRLFHEDAISRAANVFKVSPNKFKIMPEGSYIKYYPNEMNQEKARSILGIPMDKKLLLYIGLIKPYKGVFELVKAFNNLENNKDTILLIAGKAMNKEYLNKIQQQLNPNIKLKEGFVQDADLQVYFNASDIVVLPFENIENSGSVILAMGFSKPIVAPNKGVVSTRLFNQNQLLYSTETITTGILNKVLYLTKDRLEEIGKQNEIDVSKNDWADFSSCFLNHN